MLRRPYYAAIGRSSKPDFCRLREANVNELVAVRDAALLALSKNKRGIGVTPEEIRRVDQILVERWGVDFVKTRYGLEDYLREMPDCTARTQGLAAFARAHEANSSWLGERLMYDAMSNLDLCGIVTSTRRHFLIDAIGLSCGLYRALGLSGPTLDVGCHVGVLPDLTALTLGVQAVGIEPVAAAVSAGASVLADRGDVRLLQAGLPWTTDLRFELVTAIDSLPAGVVDRALFLKGLGALLSEGGIAVVTSAYWIGADIATLRRQLNLAGLGFGFADVVGGLGGMPTEFGAEGVACLIKGGKRPFPRNFKAETESEWDWFKEYANATDTPAREKTQAFMRAGRAS